jgi:thioredoxin-like negative regulator of GroEL
MLSFSCGSSNTSFIESYDAENPQTDDYATLKRLQPQKIEEDLSGGVIIITEKDFIERITDLDNPKGFQYKGRTPCMVELYADWCKPCGYLSELMRNLAPEYQGKVIFYKLNIDKAAGINYAFNVKEIPKILYFKPHGEVSSTVGYLNRKKIKNTIDKLLLNP